MKILFEALNAEASHREHTARRDENLEELLQRRLNSNSENEGKCVKNSRKALTEPWKPKSKSLKRERIPLIQKGAADQADFALKNLLVTLFRENLIVVKRERI